MVRCVVLPCHLAPSDRPALHARQLYVSQLKVFPVCVRYYGTAPLGGVPGLCAAAGGKN